MTVDYPPKKSSASQDKKRFEAEEEIYNTIINSLKDGQWADAFTLLKEKDGNSDLVKTDFYKNIYDYIYETEFEIENNHELIGFGQVILPYLLKKISADTSNFEYIKSIIDEDKISEAILDSLDFSENDSCGMASYYWQVCEAAFNTKDSRAGEFVSETLAKWDQNIIKTGDYKSNKILKLEEKLEAEERQEELINNNNDDFDIEWNSDMFDLEFGSWEKRDLLRKLMEFKDEKIVDNLIEFIEKDENGALFVRKVCDIINNIKPERAINKLLDLLKSDNGSIRRDASAMLFRLEFGRLGISREGVEYLENIIFDLGQEHNNENYHVERLTADGEIGIFKPKEIKGGDEEEYELIKYIEIGDLSGIPSKDEREKEKIKLKRNVLNLVYDTLFIGKPGETELEKQKRLRYLEDLKRNYYKIAGDKIFTETGVRLNNLSFKEQGWFMIYFNEVGKGKMAELQKFVQKYGEEGIKTFLAMEHGEDKGKIILELGSHPKAKQIFRQFDSLLYKGKAHTKEIIEELKELHPDLDIDENKILASMISRGKDLLVEAYQYQQNNQPEKIEKILQDLKQESAYQNILREKFKSVAEMLGQDEVDLNQYNEANFMALKGLDNLKNKAIFLRALDVLGKLKPIPEIFWKVDRNLKEYSERYGFDVEEFLRDFASVGEQKIILEFGPGSGKSKEERAKSEIGGKYSDFAMSDNLYYSMADTVEDLIDWDKIEQQAGKLNESDRKLIADYIYKVIVIQEGDTASDSFKYDVEVIKSVTDDPNSLKDIFANLGHKLQKADIVPTDYQTTDDSGELIYPRKINIQEQAQQIQRTIDLLKQDFKNYLRPDFENHDVYESINVHPAGVAVGDFDDIHKFKPEQLDVTLAVRSTVYKEGEDYQQFLQGLFNALKKDGIAVDDSVRDNFGRNYRLADLMKFREMIENKKRTGEIDSNININIITGPGVKGEDHNQEQVPLVLILSKNENYKKMIEDKLMAGYSIKGLDDLVYDDEYLKILDQSGSVLSHVKKERGHVTIEA